MNKKYLKYSLLMVSLLICKPSFSTNSDNRIVAIVKASKLFKWFDFKFNRDVPQATQDWARQELKDSGVENFETVPLKIAPKGMDWHVRWNRVYIPEDFNINEISDKERICAAHVLKHEMKHYNNRDVLKIALLISVTANLGFHMAIKYPYWVAAFMPFGVGAHLAYIRYQEEGAERFAFEHARDREEISVTQEKFKDWSYGVANYVYNGVFLDNNKIKNSLFSLLRPFLVKCVSQLDSCETDEKTKDKLRDKIRFIAKVADLIWDPEHPSKLYHAEMAQEYLDKWDKKQSDMDFALELRPSNQA